MTLGLAELGRQERLDKVPSQERPDGPGSHADNVHVVVLDALSGGKVVFHQRGTDSAYLVCAYRGANAAAADGHAAIDRACRHSAS